MALDDVLDETRWRWPRPDGLEFRRSASDDEPTIEVIRRRRGGFGEMAVVVLARWLTSLRGEAEEARALKKHYWRSL